MGTLVFVYIIEEVAHAHAQNAPLERLLSIPGLGVVSCRPGSWARSAGWVFDDRLRLGVS